MDLTPQWMRAAMLASLLLAGASAHAACPKVCLELKSIVHAAGVPHGLSEALDGIEFDGRRLAPSTGPALAAVARAMKDQPAKAVLVVGVHADAGLPPAAAKAQAAARVKALRLALTKAGVPARQLRIGAAG